MIGFKNNWKTSSEQDVEEYVNILQSVTICINISLKVVLYYNSDSFDLLYGVIIFRLRAGFDATDETADPAKGKALKGLTTCICTRVHY